MEEGRSGHGEFDVQRGRQSEGAPEFEVERRSCGGADEDLEEGSRTSGRRRRRRRCRGFGGSGGKGLGGESGGGVYCAVLLVRCLVWGGLSRGRGGGVGGGRGGKGGGGVERKEERTGDEGGYPRSSMWSGVILVGLVARRGEEGFGKVGFGGRGGHFGGGLRCADESRLSIDLRTRCCLRCSLRSREVVVVVERMELGCSTSELWWVDMEEVGLRSSVGEPTQP